MAQFPMMQEGAGVLQLSPAWVLGMCSGSDHCLGSHYSLLTPNLNFVLEIAIFAAVEELPPEIYFCANNLSGVSSACEIKAPRSKEGSDL